MEKYIKYKRLVESVKMDEHFDKNLQNFLDGLITDGLEILHYGEQVQSIIVQHGLDQKTENTLKITVLVGKRQEVL